eukprot:7113533-Prymnesium_polylepis.1
MDITTDRLILIVDTEVWNLYSEKLEEWADSVGVRLDAVVTAGNDDQKTLDTFTFLLDELKRVGAPSRGGGGGVLTDTAGFACACWRRGVPWWLVPSADDAARCSEPLTQAWGSR